MLEIMPVKLPIIPTAGFYVCSS